MLRIGLDVDEVLNNLMSHIIHLYNVNHNTSYTIEDLTEWDLYATLPEHVADEMCSMFSREAVISSVRLQDGARRFVDALVNAGHEVYFVTACQPLAAGWRSAWLRKQFPSVPERQHIFTSEKWLLSLDCLVDDNPDYLRRGLFTRILYTRPWNEDCMIGFDYRVNSLTEALMLIEKLGKG